MNQPVESHTHTGGPCSVEYPVLYKNLIMRCKSTSDEVYTPYASFSEDRFLACLANMGDNLGIDQVDLQQILRGLVEKIVINRRENRIKGEIIYFLREKETPGTWQETGRPLV